MLLVNYDFHDIHAVLTGIRFKPDAPYNADMVRAVWDVLSASQETNAIEHNIVRAALNKIEGIDRELCPWVGVNNVYTYGVAIIKDESCYSFLARGFQMMHECAVNKDFERLGDLADALHNIPIFFADGCRNLKKAAKIQFDYYNKKYKSDLWKELAD